MIINFITLEIRQSDIPIRGNVMASGDSNYDRRVEDELIERLDGGDIYAWFDAKVTVEIEVNGVTFEGFDTLGGCSYKSLDQFMEPDSYYTDMVKSALDNAVHELIDYVSALHGTLNKDELNIPVLSSIKPIVNVC